MTIPAQALTVSYLGTSGQNSYAFNFYVFTASQLVVKAVSPTGTSYTLVLGTDYSVTGLNPSGGPPTTGSINLVNNNQAWLTGGNLTTGWTLSITRSSIIYQPTSIRNQGDFYQEFLENLADYMTMIMQEMSVQIGTTPPNVPLASFPMVDANGRIWTVSVTTNGQIKTQ